MPKLKPGIQEERNRIVRSCIRGNQERYGVSDDQLASRIGVVTRTVQNRRDRPENFTLKELQEANQILKLTPVQAASMILGRDLTAREFRDFILS